MNAIGNYREVVSRALVNGSTKSCGCIGHGKFRNKFAEKHGGSKERLYRVWGCMLNRCYDPNRSEYKNYGGRGIKVCDEWKNSYKSFREWAYSNGYDQSLSGRECSLDRVDPDGDYEPCNCRWVSMDEQAWNKRDTAWLNYRGRRITYGEAEKIGGIAASTIRGRIERGWTTERAIEQPARKFKCGNASRTAA